jgi:hypothetical protein
LGDRRHAGDVDYADEDAEGGDYAF